MVEEIQTEPQPKADPYAGLRQQLKNNQAALETLNIAIKSGTYTNPDDLIGDINKEFKPEEDYSITPKKK